MSIFKRMRERRDAEAKRRGWDHAAGELLRGRSVEFLEAFTHGSCDPFDKGVDEAISVWSALIARLEKP